MLNAGLTGGIASGKSTVSDYLREKGAFLIDLDLLTRKVQEPGEIAWREIVRHFGTGVLNADQRVNRESLGRIVFSSPDELQNLNRMVHPAVHREWQQEIARIEGQRPDAIIISDVPLLIEVGWTREVDLVIVVFIAPEEQINRLIERNGLRLEEAQQRLASQMSIFDKLKYADFVIDNNGTVEQTHRAVDAVWEKLVELEQKKRKGLEVSLK